MLLPVLGELSSDGSDQRVGRVAVGQQRAYAEEDLQMTKVKDIHSHARFNSAELQYRVAKCQIFYTDQNLQSRFYLKKSA